MNDTVLFVDDEVSVLNAVERVFFESGIRILRATNPLLAMELFKQEEIAVVVSDNMMPEMRGTDFLAALKHVSPDTVKILMTAYADLSTALEAINQGEVYRFIVKPWDNDELKKTVELALNRYRTLVGLQREDEDVLKSLAQTIELKDPYTRGHCERVAAYSLMIADALGMPVHLKKDIRFGGWLHDCGKIGVPEAILNHAGIVNDQDFATIKKHPEWGADVARQAKLSTTVINIILYHHERFNGEGYPKGLSGDGIPLEARIVAIADVYDALTTNRPYREAYGWGKAMSVLESTAGKTLDPELVGIFKEILLKSRNI